MGLRDVSAGREQFYNERSYFLSNTGTPALGASGAVNGIVTFDILMFPWSQVLIYGIVPMPAILLGGLYLCYDVSGALGVSFPM